MVSMDVQFITEALNKSLAVEYAAVIQYYQHSFLIQGTEREYLSDFFRNGSKISLDDAERLGKKSLPWGAFPRSSRGRSARQAISRKCSARPSLSYSAVGLRSMVTSSIK